HARLNAAEELLAQAGLPFLIPPIRISHILLCFWQQSALLNHADCESFPLPLPRTCAHQGSEGRPLFFGPVLLSAIPTQEFALAQQQDRPRDPRRVAIFPKHLTRRFPQTLRS